MPDPSSTQVARTEECTEGKDRVIRHYHPNGTMVEESRYSLHQEGLPYGVPVRDVATVRWSSDGILLGKCEVRKGVGELLAWYDNGQKKSIARIVDGMIVGMMQVWDEEGYLLGERFYFRNAVVSKKRYRELQSLHPEIPQYPEDEFRTVTQKRKSAGQ